MRVALLFLKVFKDSCTVSPFLSEDLLPDDVLPEDVLPDIVLPEDVLPDDVLLAPELEPEQ